MLFVIYAQDKNDGGAGRQAHRSAHLEYLKANGATIKTAGPLLSPDGQAMVGSMLVVEAADLASARTFAEGDPFHRNGVFVRVEIHPWRASVGTVSFA
ncbi:MAG: YciI family protein [Alphaproteobacteria bacterium]|nr:YciI family protein [Alphaproteobacteria bacterium]